MKTLAPDLFQRRFRDLMEIGRAELPSLAPEWTDHNAHDPGITLMEVLAWAAEAQLYSLARIRRDERLAFAALLGILPRGSRGAAGAIWPDHDDPTSPAAAAMRTAVIPADAAVHTRDAPTPAFRPTGEILWAPGRIERLEHEDADGRVVDLTAANRDGRLPFQPFGPRAGRGDVLRMRYACRDEFGLLGEHRERARGARWPIGLLAASPPGDGPGGPDSPRAEATPLAARIILDDGEWFEVGIDSDSTRGAAETGVLLLDLDRLDAPPRALRAFTLEFRPRAPLPRPPRATRIEPNVLPIAQGRAVEEEAHHADGLPDWSFTIPARGLRFEAGEDPLVVRVPALTGPATWRRRDRLSDCGPDDRAYTFDPATGEVAFGNGVNGLVPPRGAQVLVSYAATDGARGFVARNRLWVVAGFPGTFGVNPDAIAGGADASTDLDHRRDARRRIGADRPLVSADDIVDAARALRPLDVARAWVAVPSPRSPRTGVVTLVAMRGRGPAPESSEPPESPSWLEAVRGRLAPRMLLGTRLVVVAPRYSDFTIRAAVEARPAASPSAVLRDVERTLDDRLALAPDRPGAPRRPTGAPVSLADVAAWIRSVEGVRRILSLSLRDAAGAEAVAIEPPRDGLPRRLPAPDGIRVLRADPGGTP